VSSIAGYGSWTAQAEPIALSPPGEVDALSLHDAHADFVWKTLQRLGVRAVDLEDATQDVFLVVHRKLSTFDPEQSAQGWLFGISRKVAAAYRRRAQRQRDFGETVPEQEDAGQDPEEQVAWSQAQRSLDRWLDELDDDKRVVLVMFEIEGLSCDAIAETLAIPIGTVYSRLHHARKALQKAAARSEPPRSHERTSAFPPSSRR
jgi:RNA polymerase sigma-70 factor, ECF subfamily